MGNRATARAVDSRRESVHRSGVILVATLVTLAAIPAGADTLDLRREYPYNLGPRPHLATEAPPGHLGRLDPAVYGTWYADRFLWSPEEAEPIRWPRGVTCLDHLTKVEWMEPRREKGIYGYARKRALRYFKRAFVHQLDARLHGDPSYSINEYARQMGAYQRSVFLNDLNRTCPDIEEVLGFRTRTRAAPDPYVARLGPVRIDEHYRFEIDLDDIWGEPEPEPDEEVAVPTAPARGRAARKRSPRIFDVKVSPRIGMRASIPFDVREVVRSYGARVSLDFLPRKGVGSLFRTSAGLKMRPDGEATFTLALIEKRF
jgi:hypothetical protein